jgi:hypothetical protein
MHSSEPHHAYSVIAHAPTIHHPISSQPPSNLPSNLPTNLRPLSFPLTAQRRIHEIRLENEQSEIPHERNSVEEIGVAAAGVQPQVVESWTQEGGVYDGGEGWEGVAVG